MFSHVKNPIFDSLYCAEEHFDDKLCGGSGQNDSELAEPHDRLWDDDEVVALLSKEKKQAHLRYDDVNSYGNLKTVRNEAVKWMLKVVARYRFNALTAVLAVNYFDRFVTSVSFQRDKPWMSQLSAVACLSLAAKVEETQVPLLLDIQVEDPAYVFEAKTIQRLELLVLSTLEWKMHPVTPISFFDHIVRRFELIRKKPHWDFMRRCENVMLAIVKDCKFVQYHPSVIAAATMVNVIQELDPCDALEYQNQLMSVLRTTKHQVDYCCELIMKTWDNSTPKHYGKRKFESLPSSPSGVIDAYFSCYSSNDSWSVVSASPEPLFKRTRVQDRI